MTIILKDVAPDIGKVTTQEPIIKERNHIQPRDTLDSKLLPQLPDMIYTLLRKSNYDLYPFIN